MNNLELTWQTFEFHSANIMELEGEYEQMLKKTNILLSKQVPATKWEKLDMKNKTIALCNKLISSYSKHIDCINELIDLHNEVENIPLERETDIDLFNELKDVSIALAGEMKFYKSNLADIFS